MRQVIEKLVQLDEELKHLRERVSVLEAEVRVKSDWIDYYKGKLEAIQKVLNGKGLVEAK